MQAMQYTITLPNDYDMNIIKERVRLNGFKTDKFPHLLIKAYLIKEHIDNRISNTYAPLYIWRDSKGMNEFLFNGYYDNVLKSFGWQSINIGIPYSVELSDKIKNSNYVVEEYQELTIRNGLSNIKIIEKFTKYTNNLGEIIIYNPEKWKFVKFTFLVDLPLNKKDTSYYKILHIS